MLMLRRACVAAMPSAAHRLGETVPAALRSGVRPAVVANPRGVPDAAVVQHTLAAYAAAVAEADAAGGAPAAPANDLPPHDLVGAFLRAVDRLDDAIADPAERRAARDGYLGAVLKAALRVATTMAAQPVGAAVAAGAQPPERRPKRARPGAGDAAGIADAVEPGVALPAAAVLAPPPPPVADDPSDNDDRSEAGAAEHGGGGGGSGGATTTAVAVAEERRTTSRGLSKAAATRRASTRCIRRPRGAGSSYWAPCRFCNAPTLPNESRPSRLRQTRAATTGATCCPIATGPGGSTTTTSVACRVHALAATGPVRALANSPLVCH